MSGEDMNREAMLLKIKAAEKEAVERESAARDRAARMLTDVKKKSSKIVETSETEGRAYLREQMEIARAQGNAIRQTRMQAAQEDGLELKRVVETRMPRVTEWVYVRFCRDYDVKD